MKRLSFVTVLLLLLAACNGPQQRLDDATRAYDALVLAPGAGMASAQSKREMQMMADLRMLQEQTQLLQQQLNAALVQMNESFKELDKTLNKQLATMKALNESLKKIQTMMHDPKNEKYNKMLKEMKH